MVEATYTITEKEFIEASATYCKPRAKKVPGLRWMELASAIYFVLSIWTVLTNHFWLSIALMFFLAALLLIQQWRKKTIPVYQASAYVEFNERLSIRLDDDGFYCEKPGLSKSWIAWSVFNGWQETDNMLIVGMGLMWIPIPKSAFNLAQQDQLRNLFRSHITTRP
jgi:hypothetical protein